MLYFLIIILGGIASLFAPWWIVAPVCFGVMFWKAESAKQAAAISAAALTTLWVGYATYLHYTAEVDLVTKIANLLTANSSFLSKLPPVGIGYTILTFLAGLVGSTSGLAGYHVGTLVPRK